jgi:hypothetical protein
MNVEIGTVAAQFLSWEYLFQIYGIGSLQCAAYQELQHTPPIFEVCQLITQRTILIISKFPRRLAFTQASYLLYGLGR